MLETRILRNVWKTLRGSEVQLATHDVGQTLHDAKADGRLQTNVICGLGGQGTLSILRTHIRTVCLVRTGPQKILTFMTGARMTTRMAGSALSTVTDCTPPGKVRRRTGSNMMFEGTLYVDWV